MSMYMFDRNTLVLPWVPSLCNDFIASLHEEVCSVINTHALRLSYSLNLFQASSVETEEQKSKHTARRERAHMLRDTRSEVGVIGLSHRIRSVYLRARLVGEHAMEPLEVVRVQVDSGIEWMQQAPIFVGGIVRPPRDTGMGHATGVHANSTPSSSKTASAQGSCGTGWWKSSRRHRRAAGIGAGTTWRIRGVSRGRSRWSAQYSPKGGEVIDDTEPTGQKPSPLPGAPAGVSGRRRRRCPGGRGRWR